MNKSEQLIACLEGEIAKRDEELAACRVAVENCDVFRARIAERAQRFAVQLRTERDQQAQRIGELEGLLREWRRMFDGGLASGQLGVLRGQTDAAIYAGKEGE